MKQLNIMLSLEAQELIPRLPKSMKDKVMGLLNLTFHYKSMFMRMGLMKQKSHDKTLTTPFCGPQSHIEDNVNQETNFEL